MEYYFAYGSNMSSVRLKERAPSSRAVGVAQLPEYVLKFHKRSKDGSGKCNALFTGVATDVVFGVVFEMPE